MPSREDYRVNQCSETEVRDVRADKFSRATHDRRVRCTRQRGHEGPHEHQGRPFGAVRCSATEERFVDNGRYSHMVSVRCMGPAGHDGPHHQRGKRFAESWAHSDA